MGRGSELPLNRLLGMLSVYCAETAGKRSKKVVKMTNTNRRMGLAPYRPGLQMQSLDSGPDGCPPFQTVIIDLSSLYHEPFSPNGLLNRIKPMRLRTLL